MTSTTLGCLVDCNHLVTVPLSYHTCTCIFLLPLVDDVKGAVEVIDGVTINTELEATGTTERISEKQL